jgi:hypothetical protein
MKTKEKMIADIRRVVIMANNPKCKTYEEALLEEVCNIGCQIIISKSRIGYNRDYKTIIHNVIHTEYYDKHNIFHKHKKPLYSLRCDDEQNMNFFRNPGKKELFCKDDIILGLPLTLERVLVAINHLYDYNLLYDGSGIWSLMSSNGMAELGKVCDWIPHKALDNQSQETIETMYKKLIL